MAKLVLIGLPIGNKDDLTFRARKQLEEGQTFFVEDTRSFLSFMNIVGIPLEGKKILSFHDQSSEGQLNKIIELLDQGVDICLLSEAGSPVISDPAFPVVRAVLAKGHELETLPGVSSVLVALELSGLPPHPFYFHAFLPRDEKAFPFLAIKGTHLFFESPERVSATMDRLVKAWPLCDFVLARELTKKFETVHRFKASDWEQVKKELMCKGEFVVAVYSEGKEDAFLDSKVKDIAESCLENPGTKNISKLLALLLKKDSKEVYSSLVKQSKE